MLVELINAKYKLVIFWELDWSGAILCDVTDSTHVEFIYGNCEMTVIRSLFWPGNYSLISQIHLFTAKVIVFSRTTVSVIVWIVAEIQSWCPINRWLIRISSYRLFYYVSFLILVWRKQNFHKGFPLGVSVWSCTCVHCSGQYVIKSSGFTALYNKCLISAPSNRTFNTQVYRRKGCPGFLGSVKALEQLQTAVLLSVDDTESLWTQKIRGWSCLHNSTRGPLWGFCSVVVITLA